MSRDWRREDTADLRESRRIRAELVEISGGLQLATQRLLALAAEINAEADDEDEDERER